MTDAQLSRLKRIPNRLSAPRIRTASTSQLLSSWRKEGHVERHVVQGFSFVIFLLPVEQRGEGRHIGGHVGMFWS